MSFETLDVWQNGMQLVKIVYKISAELPSSEQFGLTSQLRRAAVSILANFAEGYSRNTNADKAHKYTIARGECSEVKALLLIVNELYIIDETDRNMALDLCDKQGKILSGLIRTFTK